MYQKRKNKIVILGVGLFLVALLLWIPLLSTVFLSFFRYEIMSSPEWVGLQNYEGWLVADRLFFPAFANVAPIVIGRVVATGLVWGALQFAWRKRLRIPTMLVLLAVAPLPFFTPVGTAFVWQSLGQPSEPLGQILTWQSREGARLSLIFVDSIHAFAVATAVGLILYSLIQRSRLAGSNHPDVLAILTLMNRTTNNELNSGTDTLKLTRNLALLIAAGSGVVSFDWSYVITGGGPAYATWNPVLHLYASMFSYFKMGYGAAIATILIIILLTLGWLLWLSIRSIPIQLVHLPHPKRNQSKWQVDLNLLGVISFLPGIIIFIPIILLILSPSMYSSLAENYFDANQLQWWLNGLLAPGIMISLIQIPIALLTAWGLTTLLRLNRRLGRIMLLPFLITTLVGPSVTSGALFIGVRFLGGLNASWGLAVPLWYNGFTLLLFLLFFNGFQSTQRFENLSVDSLISTLRKNVWPEIKPLVLIVGLVSTYWASQELFWPSVIAYSPESFTPSVGLRYAMYALGNNSFVLANQIWLSFLVAATICAVFLVFFTRMLITQMALEIVPLVDRRLLSQPVPVSATNGEGTAQDLLETIVEFVAEVFSSR